jgi:DNA-binding MarR family transcriptional regulator
VKSLFSNLEMTVVKKIVHYLYQHGETNLKEIVYDFNSPAVDAENIIQRLEKRGVVGYRIAENSDLPRIFIQMIMKPGEVQELIFDYGKLKIDI